MQPEIESKVQDRKMAGKLLAAKLHTFSLTNSLVVGVPRGGACVAEQIAEQLHLPLELMVCRKIKSPANQLTDIGSISANEIYIHDCPFSVPQDYLYFQTLRLRNEIRFERDFYYGNDRGAEIEYKTVILVDDLLTSADSLMACIRDIRNQKPLRIVVAVPFATTEAARIVQAEVDDFICLKLKQSIVSAEEFYEDFGPVNDWSVRRLFQKAKGKLVSVEQHHN